jgi:hypothetical protein
LIFFFLAASVLCFSIFIPQNRLHQSCLKSRGLGENRDLGWHREKKKTVMTIDCLLFLPLSLICWCNNIEQEGKVRDQWRECLSCLHPVNEVLSSLYLGSVCSVGSLFDICLLFPWFFLSVRLFRCIRLQPVLFDPCFLYKLRSLTHYPCVTNHVIFTTK